MSKIMLSQASVVRSGRLRAFEVARPLTAKVLLGARTLVPKGTHRHGSGRRVAGPTLLASLHSRQVLRDVKQVVFEVGSALNHAATVHQGSEPHDIAARGSKPMVFAWHRARFFKGGRLPADPIVKFFRVHHPGNKRPRRYLTTPLVQFGRADGFMVSTTPVSRGFLP
jgi:hypothetical protein